jgi:hypothetical protein
MSISEVSASDTCCEEYGEFIDEKESTVAELNGCKREFTVLYKSHKYLDAFPGNRLHSPSLKTRSVTHKPFASAIIRPMEAGGRVEGKVVFEWGGEEGPSWSSGISAEAHDDKGNYAKVEVRKDSDGKGRAEVSAGHNDEPK